MNRLYLRDKAAGPSSPLSVEVEMARFTSGSCRGVPHALFAPLHYEPNYAYPLLVWLHGPNDDERQLQRIMPLLSMRNYVAVGPRGNIQSLQGRPGYGWNDNPDAAAIAERNVFEAIDAAMERFHVAPQRVFLSGLENGGTLAYRIAARYPDRFAGVLSIGGSFPASGPFGSLTDLRPVPLFVAHGRDSLLYPVDQLCTDLRLMHSAGLSITVRQYPCGDELNSQMLRDMDAWMMEIVTGTPTKPQPPVIPMAELN
jgi:phospholipase/carboxylesterase